MLAIAVAAACAVLAGAGISLASLLHEPGPGRRDTMATTVVLVAGLVGVGVAVPAAVLARNAHLQSRRLVAGRYLTVTQAKGREIFARNCATCHTLAAAGSTGLVGPNLDQLLGPLPQDARRALAEDAVVNGRAQGNGQMPAGLLRADELRRVVAFLAHAPRRPRSARDARP